MNAIKKIVMGLAVACATAVLPAMADGVSISSADGAITVTVAAGAVTESAPVYLVWDETDKGETFAAWAHSAKLGDVTSAGDTFPTTGAAHSIPNGAKIRAFVMDGDKVDLYASLTKPKSVSGLVDLGYVPGKTKGTSGIDIDFKFENLSTESGVTYMFFGICDYSSQAASEAGNSWGENFQVACDSKSGLSHQIQARPQANDHKNYKSADYTITPQNAQTLETRHVLRARTGEVPSLLLGGETVYSATSAWPNELTWDYGSGTVAVFGRNDNPPKAESPRYFKYGDMTLYGLRIYEKPESAHVCVRDYVPAEKDGTKGLYETISGGFYPVSADGFTLGGSATNSVFQSGAASSAATYEGGDTPEPTGGVEVSSSAGSITVTVAADVVSESAPVYLVWDETDKGETFADWTNKVKLGDVTSEGGSFPTTGATYSILDGAKIRAFVAKDSIGLYAAITKPKTVSGLVVLDYAPGVTKKTSGYDLDVKFENVTPVSASSDASFWGVSESDQDKFTINFNASTESSFTYWGLNVWPHSYGHAPYSKQTYKLSVANADELAVRSVLAARTSEKPKWGDFLGDTPWPAQILSDYTVPVAIFGVNYPSPSAPYRLRSADMTVYAVRIYEKPASAHVCVANYIPAEKDGVKGLYETMNGTFCPASATGFTLGGSPTNTIYTASTASTAATYSAGGEEPPTPPEPPSGDVSVSSADGAITVTVAPGTVAESTPVYLVWDETDKGETFAAWAHSAKLGDVTSAGDTFPTTGAAHGIPDGAKIRVFVGAAVEKFASITAPVGAYAYLNYHTNAKTELAAEFTMNGAYASSGKNNIMGGIQNSGSTPRVNYSIAFYSETDKQRDRFDTWTYLQANQPDPGTIPPAAGDLAVTPAGSVLNNHRGVFWMKGANSLWTPQGGTATAGTTQAPVYLNTQKFGVWCRSQGSDTNPDSNPLIYDRGGIAFHEIKFSEDGEVVRDYIPSKQNDVAGFYDLVTGEFAVKAGGSGNLTLGDSLGMVMKAGATASAAAIYDAGDTPEPPPTPPEPPSGDVEVTLTTDGRQITVTIAENAESVPVDVTLAWDTTDRGATLGDWAHSAVIGQVTGPSGSVVVDAATYGIESGTTIRAFFGQLEFALYETLTRASTSSSVVVTDYIPGKTRKTSGIDLLATWTGTFRYGEGVSALFFGITDSTDSSNSRRFGASCGASATDDNYYTIYTWPRIYNSGYWKFLNKVASKMTTANLMKLRMGEKGTWASVTLSNAWPADTDYDYTAPMSVFGITKVAAGGEVSTSAFGTYDLTLHALTVYEKPGTAHVVAAKYVPAKRGDQLGLYNTVNGAFLPATSNDGFTPGTVTNSVTGVAFSSSAATQVEFETTDFVAEVIDAAATAFDGTLAQVGLAVTYPASANVYQQAWDWDDGEGYAHDAPARYYAVGTYTNRVKLTATGFNDFCGTGVVTIAEGAAPTGAYVDYPHAGGPVKPVNGVCGVPDVGLLQTWDCFALLKNAGIPYARLHDMQLMSFQRRGIFIDIPNIFRVFTNDVEQASSYRFDFTDDLIAHLYRDNNVQPIFRLGVSREEFVAKGLPPLSARKPADALKWAKICEKVISHYTEGWNKGYTFDIPYWEIWSSPDDHPNASSNMLWNASFDDYKAFYGTVATYLKDKFPSLKFGGYTMSDVAALSRGDTSELATYRRTCAESFLAAARDNGWPLDFFSYRMTGDIAGVPADIAEVDSLLDSYGFTRDKTQRFCAEWLPAPTDEKVGSAQQLAEIAAGLTALQQGPCDFACLYSAMNARGKYAPLFKLVSPETPRATINCFKAYHELRKLGTAVPVRNLPAGVFATGASDGGGGIKLLIANVSGAAWTPTLAFAPWTVVSAVNVSNWQTTTLPASLPNNSVWLITLGLNN